MSDDPTADTQPAPAVPSTEPAPAPATTEEPRTVMGVPVDVFVRGGTTSTSWDEQKARQYAQSDALRVAQDQRYAAIDDAEGKPNIATGMLSRQLLSRANPKVVIEYVYGDAALNRECLAEIAVAPLADNPDESEMVLVLVCPYCLKRTGRMDDSQLMIRESHRKFWLDETKKQVWQNHADGSVHMLAGTITLKDRVKCSALGCSWAFRIDNSKLREC